MKRNQKRQQSKQYGTGSQLDAMRRVRKEMPPATKVEKVKNRPMRARNWRELLDDEEEG